MGLKGGIRGRSIFLYTMKKFGCLSNNEIYELYKSTPFHALVGACLPVGRFPPALLVFLPTRCRPLTVSYRLYCTSQLLTCLHTVFGENTNSVR
jgi:hypothetical protein